MQRRDGIVVADCEARSGGITGVTMGPIASIALIKSGSSGRISSPSIGHLASAPNSPMV